MMTEFVRFSLAVLFLTTSHYFVLSDPLTCGGHTYQSLSSNTWTCCAGKPYHKSQSVFACCNSNCYNAATQLCCGDDIFTKINSNSACCNGKFYQRGLHGCCKGELIDLTTHDCCRHVSYARNDSICCDGKILKLEAANGKSMCCGQSLYNPEKNICCAGNILERKFDAHTKCCDRVAYNSRKQSCCETKLFTRQARKDTCCDHQMINSKNKICCGGHSKPNIYGKHTSCCRVGESIPPEAKYSENIFGYFKAGDRKKRSHLGQFMTFDTRKQICCAGQLNDKFAGEETSCCNREAYNVKTQLCCGENIILRTPGKQERCCEDKPYDRRNHICCNGTLQPLGVDGHHIFCCGKNAYDRRKTQCNAETGKLTSLACEKDVLGDHPAAK